MKKIFINIIVVLALGGSFACEDKLEEYYSNPNETVDASLPMLLTGMLKNSTVTPTYLDYSAFKLGVTGKYSQISGLSYGTNMYNFNTSYTTDRWDWYYESNMMNSYKSMAKAYDEMSDDDKASNYIYLLLAKILLFDQSAQMVDLWGPIPWTEAASLNSSNTLSYPAYDDAATIYTTIIDSLDAINTYMMNMDAISSSVATTLDVQDILNDGDTDLWRIYANSLRLRLLMRISNYDEATASTEIAKMLADPDTYPLVESNDDNIQVDMDPSDVSLYSNLKSAFTESLASTAPYAPQYLLEDVMVANGDPRTEVYWDAGDTVVDDEPYYMGIDNSYTSSKVTANTSYWATYDSATFIYNWNVPGLLFSAAEISFLKAEAYQRGFTTGDAKTAYETGIQQSIDMYYTINQDAYMNTNYTFSRDAVESPSADEIAAYLAEDDIVYSGTSDELLAKIATQKWIHFFVLQADEAWAEYRRTGYPELTFIEYSGSGLSQPPIRITYPSSESSSNAANYAAVADYDDSSNPIFWDVD